MATEVSRRKGLDALAATRFRAYTCIMLDMRLRIPELLRDYKPDMRPTAYALAKASGGAINGTLARRLMNQKNPPQRVDMRTLDILCDVFGCSETELLARDNPSPRTPVAPAVRKRGGKSKRAA